MKKDKYGKNYEYMEMAVAPIKDITEDMETAVEELTHIEQNKNKDWIDGALYGLRFALLTVQEHKIKLFKKVNQKEIEDKLRA